MDSMQIVEAMRTKPRKVNRADSEFRESVDIEMERGSGALQASILEMKYFFLMAVVRGVYIDSDLGDYDQVAYVADRVVSRHSLGMPGLDYRGMGGIVESPQELADICDSALFAAGFIPGIARRDGMGRDFFVWVGSRGYSAMRSFARDRAEYRRFLALERNFADFAFALEHTADKYFS